MKALLLVGSGDHRSHSLELGMVIKQELEAKHIKVKLLNLLELKLPMYDRDVERNDSYDDITREFLRISEVADIVVWVTPNYHNSFSGILKNALDWQHARKFSGKVLGLASNGDRSPQPLDQLMMVARSQGYIVIPTRVCTDASDYDENMSLIDESILNRIKRFSDSLVEYAERFETYTPKEKNY